MRAGSTRLGIDPAWSRCVSVALDDGTEVEVHALVAEPPAGVAVAADGRLRARKPDVVDPVALVSPPPRRPLPRRRDRSGLDGALGADRPAALRPASRRSGADPRRPRGRRAGRSRRPRLGWPHRARLGRRRTRSRVRGIILCNTGIAMPATGVPLPIRLAGSRMLRDLGCRQTSAFVRGTLATGHGRIDRAVRAAYLAPYRSS